MFRPSLKALAMSLVLLAGTAAAAEPAGLRVTYLMYSGRPDPVLLVSDAASVRTIESRLNKAAASATAPGQTIAPILGYNGILIERVGSQAKSVSPPVLVKGSLLQIGEASAKSGAAPVRSSPAAADLEAMLLQLGQRRGVLEPQTLKAVLDSGQ